jgi:hypothetical protein
LQIQKSKNLVKTNFESPNRFKEKEKYIMFKKLHVIILFIGILNIALTKNLKAQEVSMDYFYNQLAPYGQWEQLDPYGSVWQPYNTSPGWKPYTDGYWVYTDYGWTYQADNDWAWAAYHYGRWAHNENLGWVWVPGTTWGPAWVAWRRGGQYVGWAPLPPEAEWSEEMGFRAGNFDLEAGIGWSRWSFVDQVYFADPNVNQYLQITARNVTFLNRTRNITNYMVLNHRIINNCIDVDEYERISNHRVARYNVVEINSYHNAGISRSNPQQIQFYKPMITSRRMDAPVAREAVPYRREPNEQLLKRQSEEHQQHNDHYDKRYNELIQIHDKEIENSTGSKEQLLQQHNAELRAFNEHRSTEAKVLENKHQRELSRNQPQERNNGNNRERK